MHADALVLAGESVIIIGSVLLGAACCIDGMRKNEKMLAYNLYMQYNNFCRCGMHRRVIPR